MPFKPLSRFVDVDLREYWADEARDFTPWLEQNIDLLSEAVGLELEVIERESSVGPYSADLLCRSTTDGQIVVVENQLERTDHMHLGQLLTYAGGLDALTVVWIAKRFTEEHRAALDWLNRATLDEIGFLGLEIEIKRTTQSDDAAPLLNIVCKPNDWMKQTTTGVNETGQSQIRYWAAYRRFMEDANSPIKVPKPQAQNWLNHAVGRASFTLATIASRWDSENSTWDGEIRVELLIQSDPDRHYLNQLLKEKDAIEVEIDEPLTWHDQEGVKSCRVYVRQSADVADEKFWLEQHAWLKEKLELFHRVFAPRVKKLSPPS